MYDLLIITKNQELINWKLESHKGGINHYLRNVFFSVQLQIKNWAKKGKSAKTWIILFSDLLESPRALLTDLFNKYNSSNFIQENNTYVKEILYIGGIAIHVSNRWNNV